MSKSCHRDWAALGVVSRAAQFQVLADIGLVFVGAIGNSKTFGKGYDVTGDEWMTWEAYYETAARVMDAPPITFVHIPTELLGKIAPRSTEWCVVNFHYDNIFDNTLARTDLGFQYTITWEEGVRRMVAWHAKRGVIDGSPEYPFYDQILGAVSSLITDIDAQSMIPTARTGCSAQYL